MPDWSVEIRRRLDRAGLDPATERDVVQELAEHLDDRYAELRAGGASEGEARAAALDELAGDLARELKAVAGTRRPAPVALGAPSRRHLLAELWQDVRFGARTMRKAPAFATAAIATLALGIGATTAIFTVLNAVVLRPLPFDAAERLVRLDESNPERGWPTFSVSHPNYLDWAARNTTFDALAAHTGASFVLASNDDVNRILGSAVTHTFLPVLGIEPVLGRNFRPDEDRPGAERVAILGHALWRQRFGGDPQVLGRTILLSDESYVIVGVLPEHFPWGSGRVDVLVPLAPDPARNRGDHRLLAIGRLKAGVTEDRALADLRGIAGQLEQQYPATNNGWTVGVRTFYDWFVPEESRRALLVFVAAVAIVLLIACGNVANLLLARGAGRQKEVAVRLALGARRGRVVRQLLAEAVLLSLVAGAIGVALAIAAAGALRTISLDAMPLPRLDELSIDARVLAFGVAASLLTGLVFGLVPAVQASRPDVNEMLKSGGRTGTERGGRLRSALIAGEVALSVALLVGAGLLLHSFWKLHRVSPGFDARNMVAMRISLSGPRYASREAAWSFYARLLEETHALPGVRAAALTSITPMAGGNTAGDVTVPGGQGSQGDAKGSADWRIVSPGYFAAMGIPLRGREFSLHDTGDSSGVTIVSETMARQYWPGEDPIGRTVILHSAGNMVQTIVGVAGDVRSAGLDADPRPMAYFPAPAVATWNPMQLVVRAAGDPAAQVPAVRAVLRGLDPRVPFYNVETLDALVSRSLGERRFTMFLVSSFAGVSLVLACIGLFGVMAYLVSQRTRDIGIRLTLGASRRDVFRLIVGRGLLLTSVGVAVGVGAAFWLAPLLESLLFGVEANDPLAFAAAPLLLVAVALIACYIPARRAMKVDPIVALRYE